MPAMARYTGPHLPWIASMKRLTSPFTFLPPSVDRKFASNLGPSVSFRPVSFRSEMAETSLRLPSVG